MDLNRFTEKAREVIVAAQATAAKLDNQQIDLEHLMLAMLDQDRGLTPIVLGKMGVPAEPLRAKMRSEVERLPKVTGPSGATDNQYASGRLTKTIATAEDEAKALKDEYVSVEHLLLAMLPDRGAVGTALKDLGLTKSRVLSALQEVRGNTRVTNQNPEASYQALEKYGHDLTETRRDGKLDPVIGRDEEIRRVIQILEPADQEQPRVDRRAGRRQDRHRRRVGTTHRPRRRARGVEGQAGRLARHGCVDRRVPSIAASSRNV